MTDRHAELFAFAFGVLAVLALTAAWLYGRMT